MVEVFARARRRGEVRRNLDVELALDLSGRALDARVARGVVAATLAVTRVGGRPRRGKAVR